MTIRSSAPGTTAIGAPRTLELGDVQWRTGHLALAECYLQACRLGVQDDATALAAYRLGVLAEARGLLVEATDWYLAAWGWRSRLR